MGQRGPRTKPAAEHKRQGTFRPDRHKGPEMPCVAPTMPPDLSPSAQAFWNVTASLLEQAGIISELDGASLRMLAESYALYIEACDDLNENGLFCVSEAGALYQRPTVGIRNKSWEQIVKLLREFGMTPSSRCGLKIDTKQDAEDDIKSILGLN